jgi:hypothetical protein
MPCDRRELGWRSVEAIDHVDLVVPDVERSLEFYRGLLTPL